MRVSAPIGLLKVLSAFHAAAAAVNVAATYMADNGDV